jgi:hypothetical protein
MATVANEPSHWACSSNGGFTNPAGGGIVGDVVYGVGTSCDFNVRGRPSRSGPAATADTPAVVTTGTPAVPPTTSALAADEPAAVADEPSSPTLHDGEHDRLDRLDGVLRKTVRQMSKVVQDFTAASVPKGLNIICKISV